MTRKRLGNWAVWPVVSLLVVLPLMMGQGCPWLPGEGDPLSASAGSDATVELGQSIALQGSASGGSGVYTYGWSPSTGLSSSSAATPVFTPSAAGPVAFTLTVTDSLGAQATDSVIITVTDDNDSGAGSPLVASAGQDRTVIVGSPIVLQGVAAGGRSPYTYSWSPTANLNDPTLPQPTFTPTQAGATQFTLTVTDDNGNTATDSATITASSQTTLSSFVWGANYSAGGYQIFAVFTQNLDKASAETESNYRVSGTDEAPKSAVLAADSKTVTLVFETPLASNSAIDFSMSNGLKDANGNALPAFTAIPEVNDDDTPATAPEIVANGVIWGADYAGSYQVLITLNEAIDRASAETLSAYRIKGTTITAASADLRDDGKTVEVVFDGIALSTATTIDISVGNVIQDINGNALSMQAGVAVESNVADTTRPHVVEALALGSVAAGYEISIEFSEAMSKSDVEKKEAYESSGSVIEEPTSATLSNDGRAVILLFGTKLAPTDRIRVGIDNLVKDINGRTLNMVSVEFKTDTGDVTNPNAPVLTWFNGSDAEGYQLTAVFKEAMIKASVENVNNWGVLGTTIKPSEVMLKNDLKTAEVSFAVPVRRDALIVVSVNDSIRDATGNALLQTSVPVQANPADTISPRIDVEHPPTWVANFGTGAGQIGYQLTFAYDETMDLKSVSNLTNYSIVRVDNSVNPPRVIGMVGTPSKLELDDEGRWVTLTFASISGGFRSSSASNIRDRLLISSQVRDMNGRATISISPLVITRNVETAAPTIDSITWSTLNNNRPYQVVVRFNEALDATSATDASNYRINLDGIGPTIGPDELGLDIGIGPVLNADGRSVTLTFSVDANTLFSPTLDTLIVDQAGPLIASPGVRDVNGNGTLGTIPGGQFILQDPAHDSIAPKIVEARWGEGPTLLDYRLVVTFSEGIDENDIGTYMLSGSTEQGDATLLPGGHQVEVAFDAFPYPAMSTVLVTNVFDMHGNERLSSSTLILPNPLDMLAPALVNAVYSENYPGPGYEFTVTFNEVLDEMSATNATYYRIDSDKVLFQPNSLLTLDNTGKKVTMVVSAPLSVAAGTDYLDVSIAASIMDVNRNFVEQIIGRERFFPEPLVILPNPADTDGPSVVSTKFFGEGNPQFVIIEFDEVLDRATAEVLDNYTWPDNPELTNAGVELNEDGVTVALELTSGQVATGAKLRIENVTDINGNANRIFEEVP